MHRFAPLKARLLAEKARMQFEIGALQQEESDAGDGNPSERKGYGNHLADSAGQVFERELDAAMERNVDMLLAEVDRALEKFAEGNYGVCDNCGQEIPFERLKRFPQAAHCVKCKSELERIGASAARRSG